MTKRWTRVRGKRERIRERERERERARWRGIERPGPRVNNKGTSVPAPGPAKLGGGRRIEEANEDGAWGVGGGGRRERTMAHSYTPKKQALH